MWAGARRRRRRRGRRAHAVVSAARDARPCRGAFLLALHTPEADRQQAKRPHLILVRGEGPAPPSPVHTTSVVTPLSPATAAPAPTAATVAATPAPVAAQPTAQALLTG